MPITVTSTSMDELYDDLNAVHRERYQTALDKLSDEIERAHKETTKRVSTETALRDAVKECERWIGLHEALRLRYVEQREQLEKLAASESAMVAREIERESELQSITQDRDEWRVKFDGIADKYEACVEVRDRTAVQLKEALDTIEKSVSLQVYDVVCSDLKGTQQRHKEALERVAELELAAAEREGEAEKYYELNKTLSAELDAANAVQREHDDSTDQQNKTKFNIDELAKHREQGFNAGYEKGKAEQMAEHAAELLNRKRHLCDMLQHQYVDIMLKEPSEVGGWRAPFRFEPYVWANISTAIKLFRESDTLQGLYPPGTFVMIGYNTLTRRVIAVAPENVHDWVPAHRTKVALAPEPEKN